MESLAEYASEIIREAAKSPLGIAALSTLAISVVVVSLFRSAPSHTRLAAFFLSLVALLVIVLLQPIEQFLATRIDGYADNRRIELLNKNCPLVETDEIAARAMGFSSLSDDSSNDDFYSLRTISTTGADIEPFYFPKTGLELEIVLPKTLVVRCQLGRCIEFSGSNNRPAAIGITFEDAACARLAESILD